MNLNTSANYVVYDMRSYFARQPGHLSLCPNCGKNISVMNISPSKVVTDSLTAATMPSHEFSVLYKCEACHWWAIRESWGDREGSDGPDYLVVVNENSVLDSSQTPDQDASPWSLALKSERLYDKPLRLPVALGIGFSLFSKKTTIP